MELGEELEAEFARNDEEREKVRVALEKKDRAEREEKQEARLAAQQARKETKGARKAEVLLLSVTPPHLLSPSKPPQPPSASPPPSALSPHVSTTLT